MTRAIDMTMTADTSSFPSGTFPDLEVRDVMTPGVVTIVEDASLTQACRSLRRHRVHGVLVVARHGGRPLGWITAQGVLGLLRRDPAFVTARDAIVEPAVSIRPSSTVAAAVAALSDEGVTHVLVSHQPDTMPEGIVSAIDVALMTCGGVA